MANPRVFISSTYYDLRHIRNDLQVFIKSLGYEPVMHDKGNVTYVQSESLEDSCYNELNSCDIVICIIGNKFGTQASKGDYSITMTELSRTLSQRKKVFIYIVHDVYTENETYLRNKDKGFEPAHADDIRIHKFIEELRSTVRNRPILPFRDVSEIIENLRLQFAGLFQHLLSQEASITESKTFLDLQATADTIKSLIGEFASEKNEFFSKFEGTIYSLNPIITHIQNLLGGKLYNVIVASKQELCYYLMDMGFSVTDYGFPEEDTILAKRNKDNYTQELTISLDLFTPEGKIKEIRDRKVLEKSISFTNKIIPVDDNDLPF